MKINHLFAAAALALAGLTSPAVSATVVYSSVPDLTVANGPAYCSDCYGGGTFEPLDKFTLSHGATITGLNLVTYAFNPYTGLGGFTVEIYDSAHSKILFSQGVTATQIGTGANSLILNANLTGLNLSAGTYWFGAIAPVLALPSFNNGGNGSLIDTTPHTGSIVYTLGGNSGYQLLGNVPEPATWAMMVAGFGMVGFATRRRSVALTA